MNRCFDELEVRNNLNVSGDKENKAVSDAESMPEIPRKHNKMIVRIMSFKRTSQEGVFLKWTFVHPSGTTPNSFINTHSIQAGSDSDCNLSVKSVCS